MKSGAHFSNIEFKFMAKRKVDFTLESKSACISAMKATRLDESVLLIHTI